MCRCEARGKRGRVGRGRVGGVRWRVAAAAAAIGAAASAKWQAGASRLALVTTVVVEGLLARQLLLVWLLLQLVHHQGCRIVTLL